MKTSTDAFQQKLDHYDLAAQSRLQGDKNAADWGAYAAAAGASLAMAGAADAAVIYSGVQNVSVAIDPTATTAGTNFFGSVNSTGIDIDNDATPDAFLGVLLYAGVNTTDPGNSFKYLGYAVANPDGGAAMLVSASQARKLASGSLIGPSGAFDNTGNGRRQGRGNDGTPGATYTLTQGNFVNGETVFLGLQLGSGNFGWIRLRMDDLGPNQPLANFAPPDTPAQDGSGFFDRVTAIDWAFDDSGAPIRAGQTQAVPEPSPLALLAAGAVGLGALRRRRAAKTS